MTTTRLVIWIGDVTSIFRQVSPKCLLGGQDTTLILLQHGHFGWGFLLRRVVCLSTSPMLRKHRLRCRSWSPANYPPWIVEWRCAKSLLIAQSAQRTRGAALWCGFIGPPLCKKNGRYSKKKDPNHRCPFPIGWLINRGVWTNPFNNR